MVQLSQIIIIGSGPAAHTAAIYLSRANMHPILLEGNSSDNIISGGLLTTTKTVENFPGFPEGVDGYQLTEKFKEQSLKFGTEIISETAQKIVKQDDDTFMIITNNTFYFTKTILIATGSTPNKLDIPGYDNFWHKGISTCAVCDGGLPVYRNVPLVVVGGGDSACEEALHLTHTASHIYLIHRRDKLKASKIMQDRVFNNPKIEIIWNTEIIKIEGDNFVERIIIKNNQNDEIKTINARGVFVAIGHKPNSQIVKNIVELDENGYIITDKKMKTSCEGIWAAGDVQDSSYRQAITAAGSGCIAALEIERFFN
jgi:thioredoxin reductase (NADPH)